jgi:hypothetical protein
VPKWGFEHKLDFKGLVCELGFRGFTHNWGLEGLGCEFGLGGLEGLEGLAHERSCGVSRV